MIDLTTIALKWYGMDCTGPAAAVLYTKYNLNIRQAISVARIYVIYLKKEEEEEKKNENKVSFLCGFICCQMLLNNHSCLDISFTFACLLFVHYFGFFHLIFFLAT